MAYNIFLSSALPPVLAVIIWCLVFHSIVSRVYLTFVKAVILILKHATFLRLSMSSESAITQVEMDYQAANIDLKIQQHLAASCQELSVKQFANFIMATDIGLFILSSVKIISHQAFSVISVFSWNTCA